MLAYCDFLFVEEKATFVTPFMKLAIGPEMGSSILFPKIFGAKKAMEILMLGHQLNAQQLLDYKFCNAICKGQEELHKIAYSVAEELASYD
jgi:enoyl-CoA hydratase/carnithine racemase